MHRILNAYHSPGACLHVLACNKVRGSYYHKTCRTICDRDQNEIKQSRGCLGLNQAIKRLFRIKSSDQGVFQIADKAAQSSVFKAK